MASRLTFDDDDDPPPHPRLPRGERLLRGLIAFAALLLTLVVPLAAIALTADEPPELRVAPAGRLASTLIVDGPERVLVLASNDPRDARSVRGILTRPWEPDAGVIVSPAGDDAAPGLLEILRHAPPQRLIVAGMPGASSDWHEVETFCQEHGIALDFLAGRATIELQRLRVTVSGVGPDAAGGAAVVVQPRDAGALVAIALDEPAEQLPAHLLISSSTGDDSPADIVLTSTDEPMNDQRPRVILERRDRARVTFVGGTLRVFGGTLTGELGEQEREGKRR